MTWLIYAIVNGGVYVRLYTIDSGGARADMVLGAW